MKTGSRNKRQRHLDAEHQSTAQHCCPHPSVCLSEPRQCYPPGDRGTPPPQPRHPAQALPWPPKPLHQRCSGWGAPISTPSLAEVEQEAAPWGADGQRQERGWGLSVPDPSPTPGTGSDSPPPATASPACLYGRFESCYLQLFLYPGLI